MCALSMVMDHYTDKWTDFVFKPTSPQNPITDEEIKEFRKLLERAREYDIKHNQPNCELEEKKKKLKDLATELGVEIDFI